MNKFSIDGESPLNNLKQALKIMRITLFLLLFGFLYVQASGSYSQESHFSINVKSASIKEICEELERKSDFRFIFAGNAQTLSKKIIDKEIVSQNIEEIMDIMLADTGFTYSIIENQVVIYHKNEKNSSDERERIISNIASQQQKNSVKGTVTDQEGEPLAGVTITVVGSTRGVITDVDGFFSIEAAPSDKLIFSYMGMLTQTVPIENKTELQIVLKEDAQLLEEVQIVGYGRQRKGSVTSSVASVEGTELRAPVGKLSNAFAGQIPGIISIQRSGEPGYDSAEFWIRGISSFAGGTSPLILVDGVPRAMNDIEADEIDSFTVLKDAAATAVYGAKGANGVVLITSKRGRAQRARISYRGEVSQLTPTRRPRYANSYDYLSFYNEGLRNEGKASQFSDEVLENYRIGADPDLYPSTDWWSTLINDHTYNTRHTLNFTGGTDRARYFVSGAYYYESGYFKTNPDYNNNATLRRYNLRSNIDIDVTESLLLRVDFSGQYLTQNRPRQSTQAIFDRISRIPPYLIPPVYSDGSFAQHPSRTNNRQNPWVYLTETGYQKTYRSFMQTGIHVEQKLDFITEGLLVRGMLSYDSDNNYFTSRTRNPETFYAEGRDESGDLIFRQIENEVKFGDPSTSNNSEKKIYLEAALDYKRDFGPHAVTGLLLFNRHDRQLHNDALAYRSESYVGRATYNYDNRYTVEFNFGLNGSEQFAKGNRYGFFPAVGVAWNVSNEPYFPLSLKKYISNFRVRASMGKTGNDRTGGARFLYMPTFVDGDSYAIGIGSAGTSNSIRGLIEDRFESPGISWEIETKRNIGFDLGLWDNRIDVSMDFFNDQRTDILLRRRTVLDVAGFNQNPWQNYGIVNNKGFDGGINLTQVIGDVTLSGKGTLTYAKNEIVEYDELPPPYDWMKVTGKRITGHTGQLPLIAERLFTDDDFYITQDADGNNVYTLKEGLTPTPWGPTLPGVIKYMDLNGDGRIDNNDRVYDPQGWHPANPELIYGFGLGVSYKGFYVNAFFQGAANVTVNLNSTANKFMPFHWGLIESNVRQEIIDSRWTVENPDPNAFFPRLQLSNMGNYNTVSTFWYRDGSFLRFKNLELGYDFNKSFTKRAGISASRLYIRGYNLHVWDKVKMFDPELGNSAGGTVYPLSRTWTMGLELTF